jgi:hypothetical protein
MREDRKAYKDERFDVYGNVEGWYKINFHGSVGISGTAGSEKEHEEVLQQYSKVGLSCFYRYGAGIFRLRADVHGNRTGQEEPGTRSRSWRWNRIDDHSGILLQPFKLKDSLNRNG